MTDNIAQNQILTLEDIVFENRNKEYGAYDLRKKYRRIAIISFIISLTVIGTSVIVPLIQAYNNKNKKAIVINKSLTAELENMNKNEDAPPPPPPPPPPPAAIQAQVAFVAPKVVDSVKEEVEMKTMDDQKAEVVNTAPPVDLTPVAETKEEVVVQEEPAFIVVEENATFKGGDLGAFRNDVQGKLVYPQQAAENGSEGRVFIQFAVNSRGEVCDIKVLRSSGDPLLDAEAVRVIKASPRWNPAKQSGQAVKQQFTIPITFKLQQ